MVKKEFKGIEELPSTLRGEDIAAYLDVSRATGYNLMNSEGFPSIRIGKSIRVPKEAFIRWVDANTGKQVGTSIITNT